jgi:hypothetical protein
MRGARAVLALEAGLFGSAGGGGHCAHGPIPATESLYFRPVHAPPRALPVLELSRQAPQPVPTRTATGIPAATAAGASPPFALYGSGTGLFVSASPAEVTGSAANVCKSAHIPCPGSDAAGGGATTASAAATSTTAASTTMTSPSASTTPFSISTPLAPSLTRIRVIAGLWSARAALGRLPAGINAADMVRVPVDTGSLLAAFPGQGGTGGSGSLLAPGRAPSPSPLASSTPSPASPHDNASPAAVMRHLSLVAGTELAALRNATSQWSVTPFPAAVQTAGIASSGAVNWATIRSFFMPSAATWAALGDCMVSVNGSTPPLLGSTEWTPKPAPNQLVMVCRVVHKFTLPPGVTSSADSRAGSMPSGSSDGNGDDSPPSPTRTMATTSVLAARYSVAVGERSGLLAHLLVTGWSCSMAGVDILGCHLAAMRAHLTTNPTFVARLGAMGVHEVRLTAHVAEQHVPSWRHRLMGWRLIAWKRMVVARTTAGATTGDAGSETSEPSARGSRASGRGETVRRPPATVKRGVIQLVWACDNDDPPTPAMP